MPAAVGDRWSRLGPLTAALIALLPHLGVILGRVELFYDDHRRFSVPAGALAAEAVCHGTLPAWNPYVGLGVPLLADPQTLALYPGLLLACVLPPSHALGLLFVLHLGVLAAGMAALVRELGAPAALAAGAGAAVGLAGPAVSWLTSGPYLVTLSFFPWVLLAAWRLGRDGAVPAAVALAMALGLALLGGDVPGALVAGGVALAVWASAGRKGALALAGAAALALLIGAATWAPLAWYLGRSVRAAGLSALEAGRWSFHPAELLGALFPHPLGLPLPENTFWAFGWIGQPRLFVHSIYVSALLFGFGISGAVALRRDGFARAAAIASLVLLLLASGATTPLWILLRPLFTYVRYPSKLVPYAILLWAALGAAGLARALERPRSGWRMAAAIAALLAAGAFVMPALQARLARAAGAPPEQVAAAAAQLGDGIGVAAGMAAVAVALLIACARGRLVRAAPALLGALLVADAAIAGSALRWTTPPGRAERPAWLPEGARVIRAGELDRIHLHRTQVGYLEDVRRQERLLQPLSNLPHHAGVLEGYGLALGTIFTALTTLYQSDPTLLAELTGADVLLVPSSPRQPWIDRGLASGRLAVLAPLREEGAVALRPTRALPRAYTATDYRLAPPDAVLSLLQAGAFRAGPVLSEAVALPPRPGPLQPVEATAWSPSTVRYELDRPEPCLLVVTDAFADGWRARVDGRPAPLLRANAVGRAVALPAGRHVVEMAFDVPLFRWAARAPLLGCLVALAFLLRAARASLRK
jgi:hypothetical protein